MVYAISYEVPSNPEMYGRVQALIGADQPEGLLVQLVHQTPTGLRHVFVWDSEEQWKRFNDERVRPAVHSVLASVGFTQMPPDPAAEVLDVIDFQIGRPA